MTLSKLIVNVQPDSISKSFEHHNLIGVTKTSYKYDKNYNVKKYYNTESTVYFPRSDVHKIIIPVSNDIYGEYSVWFISSSDIYEHIETSEDAKKILSKILSLVKKRAMSLYNKLSIVENTWVKDKNID